MATVVMVVKIASSARQMPSKTLFRRAVLVRKMINYMEQVVFTQSAEALRPQGV